MIAACRLLKGEASDLSVSGPASKDEVEEVEKALRTVLPAHFRQTVLNFAAAVEFSWFLPENLAMPREFTDIFGGGGYWNLSRLGEIEASRQSWIENCFSNPHDEYDLVWHDKLAFLDIPNGDMLALDLTA